MNKFIIYTLLAVLLFACQKEQSAPENPFDNNSNTTDSTIVIDPNSITGLHKNIFSVRCANPGCHDGSFEPDFRTVQSSYSTLVYKSVKKTTLDNSKFFNYRVVPGDTLNSFIHERLTTSTSDFMPSNGIRLSRKEIEQINTWIMNGAKNADNTAVEETDKLPDVEYYLVYNGTAEAGGINNRLNNNWENYFFIDQNSVLTFRVLASDDKTAVENYTINELIFSTVKDNFSSARVFNGVFRALGNYKFWEFTVDLNSFSKNSIYYFRYKVGDGTHEAFTEFPNNSCNPSYRTHFSLFINP